MVLFESHHRESADLSFICTKDHFFPIFFLKNFICQIKGVALGVPLVLGVGPKKVSLVP